MTSDIARDLPRGRVAGVDVGGTFTDLVIFDPATGAVQLSKVPTTLPNQAGCWRPLHPWTPTCPGST